MCECGAGNSSFTSIDPVLIDNPNLRGPVLREFVMYGVALNLN
jgi:hypothetical protein